MHSQHHKLSTHVWSYNINLPLAIADFLYFKRVALETSLHHIFGNWTLYRT